MICVRGLSGIELSAPILVHTVVSMPCCSSCCSSFCDLSSQSCCIDAGDGSRALLTAERFTHCESATGLLRMRGRLHILSGCRTRRWEGSDRLSRCGYSRSRNRSLDEVIMVSFYESSNIVIGWEGGGSGNSPN